jgi:ferrous iron transport protein B
MAAPSPERRARVTPRRARPAFRPDAAEPVVVLVGNPKVGKTALLRRLCDGEAAELPLAGTGRRTPHGVLGDRVAVEAPGAYSLFGPDEDGRAAAGLLLAAAAGPASSIMLVADAKNLRRALALVLQCAEYGLPMVVAANMSDEAAARGLTLDRRRLEATLGVTVCPVVATEGRGVPELRRARPAVVRPGVDYPAAIAEFLEVSAKLLRAIPVAPRAVALLLLTDDPAARELTRQRCGAAMLEQVEQLAASLRLTDPAAAAARLAACYGSAAARLARAASTVAAARAGAAERVAALCTRPLSGIPIALAAAAALYLFVGRFAAGFVVDHFKGGLLDGHLLPWLAAHARPLLPPLAGDLLFDPQLGLVQSGVFLPLGLVLPPLFCFYLFFSALEESGYLARLSFLLNRALHVVGLNGKGVLPLALGFSCVTVATLATRALDSRRERAIASFLLLLGVPCAPLLAAMLIVLGPLPPAAAIAVFGLLFGQVVGAGALVSRLLPGRPTPLLMELSPLRLPRPAEVVRRASRRTAAFLREAVPLFVAAGIAMFAFARLGGLELLARACRPVVSGVLGLPPQSVQVFLKALVRRESGAAELVQLRHAFRPIQLVTVTFLMTFAVPCINTVLVLVRERGARVALALVAGVVAYAVGVGAVLARVGRLIVGS